MTKYSNKKCRFVILISGRGSNMQELIKTCNSDNWPAEISAVISNNPKAAGLDWANNNYINSTYLDSSKYSNRDDFDRDLSIEIDKYSPDYILLAGFMRILGCSFVRKYYGKLINIHPSLLPAFPGLDTHGRAISSGVRIHGCTVHFVSPELDSGPIIAQGYVNVFSKDTVEILSERVLEIEHKVFPSVAHWLTLNEVILDKDDKVSILNNHNGLFYL
ncbi:phosphoribosylglycinamide formyltransferase 1 [Candidatus Kinetoplastibacterium blastocrithidii TCC012E]|uniref:Phosphoribosylglycinamide formyltransferase n=1 Tax=Candidatus Kinetoplastidibacterium blastocrithidiae TCC012E TaxID=1208922 RepID=M1LB28_9PROT|nr:phosphoribosylglycinamide formyltransferase [Candidatus Kinetoplastibacterium blastocrithidii]AFZ83549.1 phosphoribosylglycinamide formyltransferase [Candidatus Kinetoplastibacterium blastocrithidii (ex Strigomonas culicis)]AGF49668.1 phosphoribosylglycinamide formyltransferase 1 [Candidatus Kinetoplastibacterium blastocrithidii TCC012E]